MIAFEFHLTAKVNDFSNLRSNLEGFVRNLSKEYACWDFLIQFIKISAFWRSPCNMAVSRGVFPSLFKRKSMWGF